MEGPRPSLTRDRIVDEALALLDAEGLAGFSMRRLGTRLGVEAMSIYHHIPNRQAILVAVTERVLSEIPISEGGMVWRAQLETFAEGTYRVLMAHPAVVIILATEVAEPTSPEALTVSDVIFAGLAQAGFTPAQQVTIYHAITSMVFGFVLSHTRGLTRPHGKVESDGPRESDAIRARSAEIPHIAALIPEFLSPRHGEDFRLTLRLFLDGLERERESSDALWGMG